MKTTDDTPVSEYHSVEELLNILWNTIRSVGDALKIAREENAILVAKLAAQERELQQTLQVLAHYSSEQQNIPAEDFFDEKKISAQEVHALRLRIQELIEIVDSHL
jgi:hypothetical protein